MINNLQDLLSLLPAITAPILLLVGLLTGIVQLFKQIEEIWSRLKPILRYLFLFATQLIPVGMVVWYYMYWAIQFHSRFTERVVFLLLVAEPTILIILYEIFWGIWLYPKLSSFVKREVNEQQSPTVNPNDNQQKSKNAPARSKKRR